jgi:signal transduction histidine kinase/predicted RNA-binding protein with RPS1 domain/ActR/RegA family two-component response regulator
VIRITDRGVFLRLDTDVTGYIPRREVSWNEQTLPRQLIREGQQIETMVLREDSLRRHLVLSRRLVQRNPWTTVADDFEIGTVYPGRVAQVLSYGAFVELTPEIVGLVRINNVPRRVDSEAPIDLWTSDRVFVKILALRPDQHEIDLSIKAVIDDRDALLDKQLYSATQRGTPISVRLGLKSDPLAAVALPWYEAGGAIQRILLVDDDEIFGQNTRSWMEFLGYQVTYAASIAEARPLVETGDYELVILDYELRDGTGLELARLVAAWHPNTRLLLLSGKADQQVCRREIGVPRLICWNKPFAIHDFARLLETRWEDACAICGEQPAQETLAVEALAGQGSEPANLIPLPQLCTVELRRLVVATKAEAGLVCKVALGSQRVQVIAQTGKSLTLEQVELQQLIHSPLRELSLGQRPICISDMKQQKARFRYFLPLGDFRSFLGIPVPARVRDTGLVLLLFHPAADHFSADDQRQGVIRAGFLGLQIERQDVLRIALTAQQVILAGRLSLGLAHEVQKQNNALASQADVLNVQLQKLRRQGGYFDYGTLLEIGVPEKAAEIQAGIANMGKILQRQLNLARPYEMSTVGINSLVDRTILMVKPIADSQRIILNFERDNTIPSIYSAPLLLQQIFLNLVFNAIEQMRECGMPRGQLLVRTIHKPKKTQPIQIWFSDTGPGIHTEYYTRLFQHGFTTRNGGTGQGLYISRSTAQALGGDLQLSESYVGYGSTFELALPIRAEALPDA